MITEETKKIGSEIAGRLHRLERTLEGKGTVTGKTDFCARIELNTGDFSTLLKGTKVVNATHLYRLLKLYPETDIKWLLTGEETKGVQVPAESGNGENTALSELLVATRQQLSLIQAEAAYLRAQNEMLNKAVLNLSSKI